MTIFWGFGNHFSIYFKICEYMRKTKRRKAKKRKRKNWIKTAKFGLFAQRKRNRKKVKKNVLQQLNDRPSLLDGSPAVCSKATVLGMTIPRVTRGGRQPRYGELVLVRPSRDVSRPLTSCQHHTIFFFYISNECI